MESTIDLLARVRQGDSGAVSELMERSVPPLRRWARGRIPASARDFADTHDIVQEAFFQVLPTLTTMEARHAGTLQAVLRQAVASHLEAMLRPRSSLAAPSPLERTVGRDGLQTLAAADREAIVARVELQQSYEEVAIALGVADADAARAAVRAALARLLQAMA